MTRVRFLVIGVIAVSAALAAAQNPAAPILEVDHAFILTAPMAKEERAAVEAAGLTIGQHVAKHTGAGMQFVNSPDQRLELTFDEGRQGKRADLRPTLPLVLAF